MTNTYRGIKYEDYELFSTEDEFGDVQEYCPSELQIHNMIDMVGAIRFSPPPIFEMESFYNVDIDKLRTISGFEDIDYSIYPSHMRDLGKQDVTVNHICGTAGCALGSAAFFNIGEINSAMSWHQYARHNFGVDNNELWEFCFGEDWSNVDNTAKGAAARILMLIMEGGAAVYAKIVDEFGDPKPFAELKSLYVKYKKIVVTNKENQND